MPPKSKKKSNFSVVIQDTTTDTLKDDEYTKVPYMATGNLASLPMSRDVKIDKFSVQMLGDQLLVDTTLELTWGKRYGFLGLNGSGKSTILKCIGKRFIPIPEHFDIYLLEKEVEPTERTAIQAIVDRVELEAKRIEAEIDKLSQTEEGLSSDRITDLYEQLEELEPETAVSRVGKILHGLGFTPEMQNKMTKDFSGGWRMRIALAEALFIRPSILLLDEPTNHLDLEACVWLEQYLRNYNHILVLISHSQDFLNSVCTNILHIHNTKLNYYTGNYDMYMKTRMEKEENQMKQYNWEQDQMAHMKAYIARFGHSSQKLARQAKSREKALAKMEDKGLTEKVVEDKVLNFSFNDCGELPPPVLVVADVTFGYNEKQILYRNLDFGIDLDTRMALVGPNGVGKSTLVKLLVGELSPLTGQVKAHPHLRIGYFHQHLSDSLDENLSPLEHLIKEFKDEEPSSLRRVIGRYGVTGKHQTMKMKDLSDGIKNRVVFACLAYRNPHILMLDEPTNHLDMETIDALANAINEFEGGLVLVSHDFRLINQVAEEIWVCEHQSLTRWEGDILEYKKHLTEKMLSE